MKICILFYLASLILTASSFGGSEEKFLKKYAMMKIYESCFGPEVVKQIRKEMKAACAKCASLENPPPPPPPQQKPLNQEESESGLFQSQPTFDAGKLHQAILAYRPSSPPTPFYRPFAPSVAPFYNAPYPNSPYQPMFYPGLTGFPQQFSTYAGFPLLGQPYYGNRASRDMDFKSQLETLTSKMTGRIKNITCVMQELGYLDENLGPNFQKISERISNLPVGEELKRDMQDGVTFCQQFSQCVPEVKRDKSPLSRELIRPMFFFKCYKHKKLEACIMKDVREKYAGVNDEEFDNDVEFRRTGKDMKFDSSDLEIQELATSMYEFLYGSESNINLDGFL